MLSIDRDRVDSTDGLAILPFEFEFKFFLPFFNLIALNILEIRRFYGMNLIKDKWAYCN